MRFSCTCFRWTVVNIYVLQNTLAVMSYDGPSLPFDFKFPFQNKSILIKSTLINEMSNHQLGQQMKNKMQVKL